jgi:hypothetical protein
MAAKKRKRPSQEYIAGFQHGWISAVKELARVPIPEVSGTMPAKTLEREHLGMMIRAGAILVKR